MRPELVKFDWTPEACATLRKLWFDGLSMTEIGRQMGTSKNAVNNKVQRLGLPGRGSPIRASAGSTKPKRALGSFLPPLPSEQKDTSST